MKNILFNSLVFLVEDLQVHENDIFYANFPFRRCMNHDTQKWVNQNTQEIAPYNVVNSLFQNRGISLVGCSFKANCPLMGPVPIGSVPSMGDSEVSLGSCSSMIWHGSTWKHLWQILDFIVYDFVRF